MTMEEVPELRGTLHDRVHVFPEHVPGSHRRPERLAHAREVPRSISVALLE
jgi:hypothetical protein